MDDVCMVLVFRLESRFVVVTACRRSMCPSAGRRSRHRPPGALPGRRNADAVSAHFPVIGGTLRSLGLDTMRGRAQTAGKFVMRRLPLSAGGGIGDEPGCGGPSLSRQRGTGNAGGMADCLTRVLSDLRDRRAWTSGTPLHWRSRSAWFSDIRPADWDRGTAGGTHAPRPRPPTSPRVSGRIAGGEWRGTWSWLAGSLADRIPGREAGRSHRGD